MNCWTQKWFANKPISPREMNVLETATGAVLGQPDFSIVGASP